MSMNQTRGWDLLSVVKTFLFTSNELHISAVDSVLVELQINMGFDSSDKCKDAVRFHFYPTAFKGCVGIVFSAFHPWWEKDCPDCILEILRCNISILGRDIGWGL